MGKHADPDGRHFWVSLAGAAARATLGLLIVGGVFVLVSSIGRPRDDGPALVGEPEPAPAPVRTTDSPLSVEGLEGPTGEHDVEPVAGITVQVLDGSGGAALGTAVAEVLEDYGYDISTVGTSARVYDRTTVFYSEGFEEAARDLRRRDRRFTLIEPNTRLSETVNLHVVIGTDWG